MDRVRFDAAIIRFDAANSADPRRDLLDGTAYPRELLYAERMSARLERFDPDASEALKLAARCQHIRRWLIPRTDFPEGRSGYRRWRTTLYEFHADAAGEILADVGYDSETIAKVQDLVRKRNLREDPESQTLEDVVCLVFIEHYLEEFARSQDQEKLVKIVRKTWAKMSERGHRAALELELPPELQQIIARALRAV